MEAHYKKLNTQLIAEVQSLRLRLAEFRRSEVALQALLFEERANQQKTLRQAVNRFVQSLGIPIGSDIDNDDDTEQSIAPTRRTRSNIERRSSVDRGSSIIRTSSSSSLTISPSDRQRRRSSTSTIMEQQQEEEPQEPTYITTRTLQPRRMAEMEMEVDDLDSPTADNGAAVASPASNQSMFLIVEESTIDITSPSESIDSVSDASSIITRIKTPSPSGRVLRDLSINVPTICINRTKEKSIRSLQLPPAISCDTTREDEGEMSVQQIRHAPTRSPVSSRFKLTLGDSHNNFLTVTPRRSQFESISAAVGCTSTPHNNTLSPGVKGAKKKLSEQKAEPENDESEKEEEEEEEEPSYSLRSGRPSRSCKPVTLTEPKLGTKLRNESAAPKKTKKRSTRSKSSN